MRRYKLSGVYCLENKTKNKYYIGQSNDIQRRYSQHKSACKLESRHNEMYIDMKTDEFILHILQINYDDNLEELEQLYVKKFGCRY